MTWKNTSRCSGNPESRFLSSKPWQTPRIYRFRNSWSGCSSSWNWSFQVSRKAEKHFLVSIENSSFTIGRDSSGNLLPWSRSSSPSTFGFFIRTLTLDWVNECSYDLDKHHNICYYKLSLNQKEKFAQILKPNYHEWDPVLNEKTSISEWRVSLPKQTCLITARDTVRTIKELTEFFKKYCPNWNFETIEHGGHMAPVTNFEIVNPIIIKNLM